MDFKQPTSKAEMDALRTTLRQKVSDNDLTLVVGGNDDIKGGSITWTCQWCHQTFTFKKAHDAAKHCTKCPKNPYM